MPALSISPLEDYDIDPITGFLPRIPPLKRLPNPYYEPWEDVVDDLNGLLLAGRLRERVHKLAVLDTAELKDQREYQRAFLVLCLLSHGYVWGKHEVVSEILPACLAIPWTKVATRLGMLPVVCHAAVVLWNWRKLFKEGPIDLSNISTLSTYSGAVDESWFYLTTTAMEAAGAPSLTAMVSAIRSVSERDHRGLLSHLHVILASLKKLNVIFVRMYEKCDPYVFYWKIRPYLAGWENMAEAGLPLGLIYEGVDTLWEEGTDYYADISHLTETDRFLRQYRKYAGGSAAQSSLIHALDIFFGVEHHPTGDTRKSHHNKTFVTRSDNETESEVDKNDRYNNLPPTKPATELDKDELGSNIHKHSAPAPNRNNFLQAMRGYMPGPHRRFLEDLSRVTNVRPYMLRLAKHVERGNDAVSDLYSNDLIPSDATLQAELVETFNACLHELKLFRDKHVQVVSVYIINQARKGPSIAHGGFAIAHGEEASKQNTAPVTPPPSASPSTKFSSTPITPQSTPPDFSRIKDKPAAAHVPHLQPPAIAATNILYPQTALNTSPATLPSLGLAKSHNPKSKVFRGTGGTNLMPFLKQSRDETAEAMLTIPEADKVVKKVTKKREADGWGWLARR
ncbi:Indoleamine 2,3-dioxygenase-domain-containing protein [Endogone sp. FLAS-F59071]|nr:Indoleamine 2,3-dioxygenase-domain-containing protein [Endogone sp. FLAS-F59071]|eukprot:RUS20807.1 Indoleamine 2,3-dioxygenase-domain-containing protein [Endogone sp. FLAS-F59071]